MEETISDKISRIDKKLDYIQDMLEDIFLTPEENALVNEADIIVKNRKFEFAQSTKN